MALKRKPQFIPPAGDLRRKAVNFRKGMPLKLSSKDIAKIEQAIERSSDQFSREASIKLRILRENFGDAADGGGDLLHYLGLVRTTALDLKGLGSTFGYPLLTRIAKSLHDYTKSRNTASELQMMIIKLHIDTLYLVLYRKISGEGGSVESELVDALNLATRKFA